MSGESVKIETVAGHTFDSYGICACGRIWRNIAHVDTSYVGQPGIAHTGELYEREAFEIMKKHAAEVAAAEIATKEIAGGG